MDNHQSYRPAHTIAHTAIMAALASVLGIIGIFIPPLALVTNFLWLVPLIVLTMQKGLKAGISGLAVTALLLALVATPLAALFLLLEYSGLALFYGWAFRRQLPLGRVLLGGAMIAVVGTAVTIILSLQVMGLGINDLAAQFQDVVPMTMEMYRDTGLMERMTEQGMTQEELQASVEAMTAVGISILPGILMINAIVTALLSLVIARSVLRRLRIPVPGKLPAFSNWRLDWRLVWGFIFGLVLSLVGSTFALEILELLGRNLMVAFSFLFGVSGLAIVVYGWKNTKISPPLKFLFLFGAILYFQVALMGLVFMGLFDVFFDYRKSFDRKGGKTNGSDTQK